MAENRRQSNSTFTVQQEVFIVEKFAELKSPKLVKNAFVKEFKDSVSSKWLWKIKPDKFQRVYDRFKKNGFAKSPNSRQQKGADRSDEDKVESIREFFIMNPMASIFDASKDLKIPESTIRWNLKFKIKMKPYKMGLAQALTEAHKARRFAFCQWLLTQPENFVQLVIFGDEKWFTLTQHPNRQNTRYWAFANPNIVSATKVQGCAKIQAFVCVVNGRVLPVIWHVDEEGKSVSVNTERYKKVIDDIISNLSARELKKYYWQQDGASCHTSKASMEKLRGIFGNRIISQKAEIEWPAKSPDLNPLDFAFWGMAMKEVWEQKPETIPELVSVVENFFESLSEEIVRKSVGNIMKRAELCVKNKGGHFENEM